MAQDSIFGYVPPAVGAGSVNRTSPQPNPTGWPVSPTVFANQANAVQANPGVASSMTPGYTPQTLTPAAASVTPPGTTPTAAPTLTPLAYAGLAGAQAGAPAAQAYDTKSGVVGALGAAASGAAAGAIIGGPAGALAGGGIGLLTGGLNAYLSVGAKNKAERDAKRLLADAERKQAKRDALARSDALSQQAYDRKQVELQKKWAKSLQVREAIKGLVSDGTTERDRYVATGRV